MADNIAKGAPLGVEHFHAPFGLGGQIDHIGDGGFGRCGEAVFDVFVALAEHLQIGGENQRRAFGRLRTLDEVFHKFAVAHHIKLKPKRCTGVFGHIFNRANRHGGKRKRHTEFFGGARG